MNMINKLFISASSACFELENELPYYAPESFAIFIDGEKVKESNSNVLDSDERLVFL